VPFEDRSLGDRFPHLGHLDLDDRDLSHEVRRSTALAAEAACPSDSSL
jgi:hypothetical protein